MAFNRSYGIGAAVGAQPGAVNTRPDVEIIQRLLNEHAAKVGYAPLTVNGLVTPEMIQAIRTFQLRVLGVNVPDGRVDPSGKTLLKLNDPGGAWRRAGAASTLLVRASRAPGCVPGRRQGDLQRDDPCGNGVPQGGGRPEVARRPHDLLQQLRRSEAGQVGVGKRTPPHRLVPPEESTATVWQHVSWQDFLRDASGMVPVKQGNDWAPVVFQQGQ